VRREVLSAEDMPLKARLNVGGTRWRKSRLRPSTAGCW
jgi:hypothetical protein